MKRQIIFVTVSILLLALLLIPTACVPKKTTTTASSTTDQLQSRISSLESKVSSQSEQISTLKSQSLKDWQPTIDQLQQKVNTLESKNIELQAKIVKLETIKEEEEIIADSATRWLVDFASSENAIGIDYTISPYKIEEDGDYTINLHLVNSSNVTLKNLVLNFTLIPRADDRVFVDSKNTFLDTVSKPYTMWNMEIITRGDDKYVRRITFLSDEIKLFEANSELTMKLLFSLTYN